MRDVEGEARHFSVRETNSSSAPRKPSISAAPTKSGTRNTRILAMLVSNTPSATPATSELDDVGDRADQTRSATLASAIARPQGTKTQMMSET